MCEALFPIGFNSRTALSFDCDIDSRGIPVDLTIETELETDGRWIAEVAELPGTLAYGEERTEAIARVQALALRVLADRLEHGETIPHASFTFVAA